MSHCTSCSEHTGVSYITYNNENCEPKKCENPVIDSSCVVYTGAALNFTEITSGDTVEEAIIKIEEAFDKVTAATFTPIIISCLKPVDPITSLEEFSTLIGTAFCNLQSSYNAYVVSNNTRVTNIENDVDDIINPGIVTCPALGVIVTDTLPQILVKYGTAICTLLAHTDISGVSWGAGAPSISTIGEAFTYVLSLFTADITFNNVGSCLINPVTTTDSVTSTINNIKATLCDVKAKTTIPAITPDCLAVPATFASFYSFAYTNIVSLSKKKPTFDAAYFTVTPKADPCQGVDVTLNSSYVGKVKTTVTDVLDYLETKFTAGANIAISTVGEKVKIDVTGMTVAHDGVLTIATSGVASGSGSFTANQSSNTTVTINVPQALLSVASITGGQEITITQGIYTDTATIADELTKDANDYSKVVDVSSKGFDTKGAFTTKNIRVEAHLLATNYIPPEDVHFVLFDLMSGTLLTRYIEMPDPALYPGREIKFKVAVSSANNDCTFAGSYIPKNMGSNFDTIQKNRIIAITLKSIYTGPNTVWEVISYSDLTSI